MTEPKPLLVDTGRGFSLYWRERWLYSRYDPARNPQAAAQTCVMQEQTLYLIPSPCLCFGIAELSEALPASSRVLCVESSEELMAVAISSSAELRARFPALKMIRTDSPAQVVRYARALGRFRRVVTVQLSQGWTLDQELYAETERLLRDDIATHYRNRLTLVRMGRLWVKNLIGNVAGLPWNDVTVFPALVRKPIVVCGAGPSLDDAFPFLRLMAGRCHIMACDTACGALAQAGIIPDSVVCLEGQIHNIPDFLPLNRKKTLLFADIAAHPSSFRCVAGKKVLVSSQWLTGFPIDDSGTQDDSAASEASVLGRLAETGIPVLPVPPLGSVGVLALHLAGRLAGSDIYVTGLDFSFFPGKTHCSGSPAAIAEYRKQNRLYNSGVRWAVSHREGVCKLEPDSGNTALCDPALAMYAGLARNEIITLSREKPGLRVFDLRQGKGFSLPLEAISFEAAMLAVKKSGSDENGIADEASDFTEGASDAGTGYVRNAKDFLSTERGSVERLRQDLKNGADKESLKAQLARLEYLYAHFPDSERVLCLEQDALNRVAAEAAYWQHRIQTALEILEERQQRR